jgi:hypothetical protein
VCVCVCMHVCIYAYIGFMHIIGDYLKIPPYVLRVVKFLVTLDTPLMHP